MSQLTGHQIQNSPNLYILVLNPFFVKSYFGVPKKLYTDHGTELLRDELPKTIYADNGSKVS